MWVELGKCLPTYTGSLVEHSVKMMTHCLLLLPFLRSRSEEDSRLPETSSSPNQQQPLEWGTQEGGGEREEEREIYYSSEDSDSSPSVEEEGEEISGEEQVRYTRYRSGSGCYTFSPSSIIVLQRMTVVLTDADSGEATEVDVVGGVGGEDGGAGGTEASDPLGKTGRMEKVVTNNVTHNRSDPQRHRTTLLSHSEDHVGGGEEEGRNIRRAQKADQLTHRVTEC